MDTAVTDGDPLHVDSTRNLFVLGITVLLSALCASAGAAQPHVPDPATTQTSEWVPTVDDVGVDVRKALILFVRFQDDADPNPGCTEAARQWKDPDQVPEFAEFALSPRPAPPFDTRSLSHYFFQQSNQRMILYGTYFNRVIVTEQNESDYGLASPANSSMLDLGRITREVIAVVDEDPSIDLSQFDANGDGIVDFVFVIIRSLREKTIGRGSSGIARLYHNSDLAFGTEPLNLKRVVDYYGGAYIKYNNAGNIFPEINLLRLMAHEFTHALSQNPYHIAVPTGRLVGYQLMGGGHPPNVVGSQTLSAVERDRKGWISCDVVTQDSTIEINDLYSSASSNCVKIPLAEPETLAERLLYLSNRQRMSRFDTLATESCYGERSDHGLMTTGLLATVVDGAHRVSTLAADGSVALGITTETYDGDMFGPDSPQLTPWTIPNIFGRTGYADGVRLADGDFVAIDNIRYHPLRDRVIVVDYRADFRTNTVFRSDSRIGPESADVELTGTAVINSDIRLETETGVRISGTLKMDSGSALHVAQGSDLRIDRLQVSEGATVTVSGTLVVADLYGTKDRIVSTGGSVSVSRIHPVIPSDAVAHTEEPPVDRDETSADRREVSVFPNPFSSVLSAEINVEPGETVDVDIVDVLGRVVARPIRGEVVYSYRYRMRWQPPATLARATYFVRVRAGDTVMVEPVAYAP